MAVGGVFTVNLAATNPWLVLGIVVLVCATVIAVKGMQSGGNEKNNYHVCNL